MEKKKCCDKSAVLQKRITLAVNNICFISVCQISWQKLRKTEFIFLLNVLLMLLFDVIIYLITMTGLELTFALCQIWFLYVIFPSQRSLFVGMPLFISQFMEMPLLKCLCFYLFISPHEIDIFCNAPLHLVLFIMATLQCFWTKSIY